MMIDDNRNDKNDKNKVQQKHRRTERTLTNSSIIILLICHQCPKKVIGGLSHTLHEDRLSGS